jgi:hypothetical protein
MVVMFQSPSLRGSGRFKFARVVPALRKYGFNPLHCGAVVASARHPAGADGAGHVSIPFIAGQWSLRSGMGGDPDPPSQVSIPFIAGQWSLLFLNAPLAARRGLVSIPFIAGQWSLPATARSQRGCGPGLNPLHCGAVVASCDGPLPEGMRARSQSPSLRGSGRFLRAPRRGPR